MSIKKIPICPFCRGEMQCDPGHVWAKGVDLPQEIENVLLQATAIEPSAKTRMVGSVKDWLHLRLFVCQNCGFAALWRGEPR
jgi:hypothetical protein